MWQGETGRGGYGRFVADEKDSKSRVQAHKWIYEVVNGPIPDGFQVDHKCHSKAVEDGTCDGGDDCRHRRCCNPDHLEAVTPAENTFRQNHANRRKTHCPAGHEYTPENTAVRGDGARRCLTCERARRAVKSSGTGN